jgi:hypothetical protein
MRDSGMVLSYGVATARDGRIRFDHTGPIGELEFHGPIALALPAGTARLFNADYHPLEEWRSINATADFRWTGQAAAAMYAKATGGHIDGFVGVDVPALAAVLRVIGPVSLDGQDITADNVASVLLHDAYQTNNQEARREKMAGLGADVMQHLTSGRRDMLSLGRAVADAAAGGHIRLWSAEPSEEELIERLGIGGAPAAAARAGQHTFHVAVENAAANKVDYYLQPSLDALVGLDNHGAASVRLRVVLKNTAPTDGQPSYDLGPDHINTNRPGEYAARVVVWAPPGSLGPDAVDESGLDAVQKFVSVEPGATVTLEFIATLRDAVRQHELQLRFVPQSRLVDMPLDLEARAYKVHFSSEPARSTTLSRPLNAVWKLGS